MDLEFTPGILDTPSLLTPNIGITPILYKSLQNDTITNDNNNTQTDSTSNPSSIISTTTTTTNDESLSASSAEIKLSKIENDLKQSFSQPRKPTESPFQKIVEAGVIPLEKNPTIPPTTINHGIPVNVPSTAEVMNDIESFSKYPVAKDTTEREIISSDTNRFDTSPTQTMGVIVSPKKKLLIRSQSHTEPKSPTSIIANNLSQLQKSFRDEENSADDDHNNQFQRLQDLPVTTHNIDRNSQLDNNHESTYTIQLRTNPNGIQQTVPKQQQQIVQNNKRTFTQTIIATAVSKANSILLSQPNINEVTSSDQSLGIKRQKTASTASRQSFPMPIADDNDNNNNGGSDDHRKKQIRDSNREAARRCRERRRTYIETLEGNLEQCKAQVSQLKDNLARAERENTQLRAIIAEAKLFHSNTRIPSNESMLDFSTIVTNTNGIDLNSETTDGHAIQRSFITRNNH